MLFRSANRVDGGQAESESEADVVHYDLKNVATYTLTEGAKIMSNVLFLDIDGVLNSNFWNESHQTEISDGTLIDEEKIKLLARLVKESADVKGI